MDDLDIWLDFEAERLRQLVQTWDGMPVRFDALCRETAPYVTGIYRPTWDRYVVPEDLPRQLYDRWLDHGIFWEAFVDRNPRIHLADILLQIAGADGYDAWPSDPRWSNAIREWTRSGFAGERPWKDRFVLDCPSFRQRLWDVAQQCGQGWVLWDEPGGAFVWIEDRHIR